MSRVLGPSSLQDDVDSAVHLSPLKYVRSCRDLENMCLVCVGGKAYFGGGRRFRQDSKEASPVLSFFFGGVKTIKARIHSLVMMNISFA